MSEEQPDWECYCQLSPILWHQFAAEQWYNQVLVLYNEVVCDPEADSDIIKSYFLCQYERQGHLRLMFSTWMEEQRGDDQDGPLTYEEILQFIHHLAWCEQKHAHRLKERNTENV